METKTRIEVFERLEGVVAALHERNPQEGKDYTVIRVDVSPENHCGKIATYSGDILNIEELQDWKAKESSGEPIINIRHCEEELFYITYADMMKKQPNQSTSYLYAPYTFEDMKFVDEDHNPRYRGYRVMFKVDDFNGNRFIQAECFPGHIMATVTFIVKDEWKDIAVKLALKAINFKGDQ